MIQKKDFNLTVYYLIKKSNAFSLIVILTIKQQILLI